MAASRFTGVSIHQITGSNGAREIFSIFFQYNLLHVQEFYNKQKKTMVHCLFSNNILSFK